MQRPVLETHQGITVVRDDLMPGGTKSRFLLPYLKEISANEIVYASPPEGGAQVALAICAYQTGKQATIFTAKRKRRSPYTQKAADYGAKIVEIRPGYFSVVQARARAYADEKSALELPFGLAIPNAVERISEAAKSIDCRPQEVWCAGGSGVLSSGLRAAWPDSDIKVVQIGKELPGADFVYPSPFTRPVNGSTPFPSNPYYDAKAWEICTAHRAAEDVLFWNVAA